MRAATLGYTHVDELPDRVFRDLVLEQSGELVRGLEGQLAELASDDCWPLRLVFLDSECRTAPSPRCHDADRCCQQSPARWAATRTATTR